MPSEVVLANLRVRVLFPVVMLAALIDSPSARADDEAEIQWLNFMDHSVSGLYGSGFEIDDGDQATVSFEHVSDWKYGDNFAFLDVVWFKNSPAGADDQTWYGEISPRLSLSKILGKDLSFSIFGQDLVIWRDTLLAATYERGEDEDLTESILLGLGFDFDLSALGVIGDRFRYFQANFYARNELGCCAGDDPDRGFNDMQITVSAAYPFAIGQANFLIDGFMDYVVGFGPQESNIHVVPQIKLDVGDLIGLDQGRVYLGTELDYWHNKFGLDGGPGFDTDQFAASVLLKAHF